MEFNIGMMTSDMTQEVYYLQSSLQVLRCKATNPLVAKVDIFADWPLNISCKSLHAIQQSTFFVSFLLPHMNRLVLAVILNIT